MGAFGGFVSGFSKEAEKKKNRPKKDSGSGGESGGGGFGGEEFADEIVDTLGAMKKGGKIRKTGPYKLHKGERVLNVKQTRKYDGKKR